MTTLAANVEMRSVEGTATSTAKPAKAIAVL